MTPSRTREVAEELVAEIMRAYHADGDMAAVCKAALHAAEERGRVAGRREALEEAARAVENDCGIGIQHGDKIRSLIGDAK